MPRNKKQRRQKQKAAREERLRKAAEEELIAKEAKTKADEEKLRRLASKGKLREIQALLEENRDIDVNAPDPESGRTAMHWAAANSRSDVLTYLPDCGGDMHRKDKAEFTPIELALNPIPKYSGEGASLDRETSKKYIEDFQPTLGERGLSIHYAVNIAEMLDIIERNPSLASMGFVIETPNIFKHSTDNSHVIPIVFIRKSEGEEAFLIFDAAYVSFVPISAKDGVEREVFFTPFPRQASGKGCFREAILVLIHALLDDSLLDFARANSRKVSDLTREIDDTERALLKLSPTTVDGYIDQANILARLHFDKASYTARGVNLAKNVHILTLPPLWFFRFVENFRTLRLFKSHPKVKSHLSLVASNAEQLDIVFRSRSSGLALTAEERSRCVCSTRKEDDFNLYRHQLYATISILATDIINATRLLNLVATTSDCSAAATSEKLSQAKYSLFIPYSTDELTDADEGLADDEVSELLRRADVCLFAAQNGASVAHYLADDKERFTLTMR